MFSEDRPVGNPAQIFRSFLKNKGLRNTPQRQQIMEVFFNESGHLTTEEIYDRVRKEDPSLGQATVYRTMKLLCEAGLAREVRFGDGLARYEHAADAHHDHLICENCGRNIEVVDSQIEELQDALARKHGFKPTFPGCISTAFVPIVKETADTRRCGTDWAGGVPSAFLFFPFQGRSLPCVHAIS